MKAWSTVSIEAIKAKKCSILSLWNRISSLLKLAAFIMLCSGLAKARSPNSTPVVSHDNLGQVLLPAQNSSHQTDPLLSNPIYLRGVGQRDKLFLRIKDFINKYKVSNQNDQIVMKITKVENELDFFAASKISLSYDEVTRVMEEPAKFGEWSMKNINDRPDGQKYFLEISQINIFPDQYIMNARCLFQFLMIQLSDTIGYHFFFEPVENGLWIYVKIQKDNGVVSNMEGHFFSINGAFLGRSKNEVYVVMQGQSTFLSIISPLVPLDMIKSELTERLDRMINNLYNRSEELGKLKPEAGPKK